MSVVLTERNQRAIDLYLSGKKPFRGNGTACWQAVYETRSSNAAAAAWSRMLRNDEARVYLERHQKVLEDERAERIAYEQAEAVRDFLAVRNAAMRMVNRGRVARKVKRKSAESGAEIEEVEYADVQGMLDPGEALRAIEGAVRVQGKHPDQRAEGAGVAVNIQIDTQWRGHPGAEPIDVTETPAEPPESEEEPPRVVIIGRE